MGHGIDIKDGPANQIQIALPASLVELLMVLYRQRFTGRLVLDMHQGRVCKTEQRITRHHGGKRKS